MRIAVFFVLSVLLAPSFAAAQSASQQPALFPQKCTAPNSVLAATESKDYFQGEKSDEEIPYFMRRQVFCPSACINVRVTITRITKNGKSGVNFKVVRVNTCANVDLSPDRQNPPQGCGKGQKQPDITVDIPEIGYTVPVLNRTTVLLKKQTIGPKSRCAGEAAAGTIDKVFGKLATENSSIIQAAQADIDAYNALPRYAEPMSVGAVSGNDALVNAFKATGVSEEQAKQIVAKNPSDALAYINAINSGDQAQISAAASKLGLNADLTDEQKLAVREATDASIDGSYSSAQVPGSQQTFNNSQTNGALPGGKYAQMFSDIEKRYNLPSGYLAGVAKVESNGNPMLCARTSSACGMFQYTERTWAADSARINGGVPLPLSARFDPEVSAQVTAAATAYYNERYSGLITQSGMNPTAALYSIHNLGSGGGPRFMIAYAQNPNQLVSSVLTPIEIRNNPSLYGNGNITLAQAEQNMLNKMSGSTNFRQAFVGSPFAGANYSYGGAYGYSSGYIAEHSYRPFTSPFAQVNPFQSSYSGPASTGGPVSTGGQIPTDGQVPTDGTIPTGGTTGSGPIATTTVANAVATIIAQPSKIKAGGTVNVSWSSAGVRSSPPCRVTIASSTTAMLANVNDGSRVVRLGSVGTYTFRVQCTSLPGSVVERTAAVSVE